MATKWRLTGPCPVQGAGRPDEIRAGGVDPPVLAEVILPRGEKKDLCHPVRVLGVAVEPPSVRPGAEANLADLVHQSKKLGKVGPVDDPGVEHHHRPAFDVIGVLGDYPVLVAAGSLPTPGGGGGALG